MITERFFVDKRDTSANIATMDIGAILAALEKKGAGINRKKSSKQIERPKCEVRHVPLDQTLSSNEYLSAYDLVTAKKEFEIRFQPQPYHDLETKWKTGMICELSYHGTRRQLRRMDAIKNAILNAYCTQDNHVEYPAIQRKEKGQLIKFPLLKKVA